MVTKRNNSSETIAAFILFYLTMPYFVWGRIFSGIYVKTILSFMVALTFIMHFKKLNGKEKLLFLLFLVAVIIFMIVSGTNFNYFLTIFPVVFIPFAKESFMQGVYNKFLTLYTFFVGASLLVWLVAILGIIPPVRTTPPLNPLRLQNYYVYPLLISTTVPPIRFFGPFDEPGVVGTLSGIMLCIEGLDLKKRKNIILLLSGLCSLSMFFYLLIGVYMILFYSFEKHSIGKTIGIVIFVLLIYNIIQSVPQLNQLLGSRLERDSQTGTFVGDNRIRRETTDEYIESMINNGTIWFGIKDRKTYLDAVAGSSSYLTIIILNGLFFFIWYIVFFILYAFQYRRNIMSFLLFIYVLFSTIYQRPSLFDIVPVFLFVCLAKKRE